MEVLKLKNGRLEAARGSPEFEDRGLVGWQARVLAATGGDIQGGVYQETAESKQPVAPLLAGGGWRIYIYIYHII